MRGRTFFSAIGLSALSLALLSSPLFASDWPHWLGPEGNNTTSDAGFEPDLNKWKISWKTKIGQGYSSVTVDGGFAFTMGHDGKANETIDCFDANTGDVRWKYSYPAELLPSMHPGGPNASPTILSDKVITVSKDGQVFCLSRDAGKKIWRANLLELLEIKMPRWGFASSPVLHEGKLFFSAGRVVALDLDSGKPVWTSTKTNKPGYTTTVIFRQNQKDYVAALDGVGISILSAVDGREIARRPFKAQYDMIATTPIVFAEGNQIFSSGGSSAELLDFDGSKLTLVWGSKDIRNTMNNSVVYGGVIYGIDGKQGSAARLVAVNLADGKVNWFKEKFGYGNLIGIGGKLLSLTESGELVTFLASPSEYSELGRLQVLGKTCWTPPVYASGQIFVRNDRGDLVCLTTR